jgi:type II secretion system protein H
LDGERVRDHRNGFTLLEIIAVLTLMACIAALTLPAFIHGTRGVDLRLCRDRLLLDLRTARAEAIGHSRETAVSFTEGGYELDLGPANTVERTLPDGFSFTAIQGGEQPEEGTEVSLVFGPDGRSSGINLVLDARGRTYSLLVEEDGRFAWQ